MSNKKFRVWDKRQNKFSNNFFIDSDGIVSDSNGYEAPFYDFSENYILSQFSGCKDQNDKEIWEGDICVVQVWFGSTYTNCNLPIIFKEGIFGYELYCGSGDYQMMELGGSEKVIGNIYQNTELIK